MKFLSNIIAILFGLGLLAGIVAGLFWLIQFFIGFYASLDGQLSVILVTAAFTVIISAMFIAAAIRGRTRQEKDLQLRGDKIAVYDRFLENWLQLLQKPDVQSKEPTLHTLQLFQELNRYLTLRGSHEVLKECLNLKKMQEKMDIHDPKTAAQLGKTILAMRKDLGQKNVGLRAQDLLDLMRHPVYEIAANGKPESAFEPKAHVKI
ncbi:MAG: hypothetical protein CV087_08175 [Candidatus Brocadia sp. WS118]|nr:MAG: hypothetical protein CV087_08175 [Candidatus Brocadia sp. WS118]